MVYLGSALWFAGMAKAYPGDELRFIETSRLFAGGMTLDLLRHYPEMSGPLPFAVFSLWGGAFGWALSSMRILAVVIGFSTLMLVFAWLREALGSDGTALGVGLLLCLNPYVAAMSVFLYTDMISVFFVMAALLAVERKNAPLLVVSLAAALLCRQYLVFVAAAFGVYYLVEGNRRMLAAVLLSAIPFAWLVWFWHGLAPASAMRAKYPDPGIGFHIAAFVGYVGLVAIFLAPLVMVRWRIYVPRLRIALLIGCVSLLAWVFPVRPSPSAVDAGLSTVGLLDRGLQMMIPAAGLRDLFYWIAFSLGLLLLAVFLKDAVQRRLPALLVVAFLFVMPFSYLYWEKYMLPVLPVAAVAILRKGHWYPESI